MLNDSDFELRVKRGLSFQVHRAVLGARSDYFRLLFAGGATSVQLDMEPETAERILQYVYKNLEPYPGLDWPSLIDLYIEADNYSISGLKEVCGERMVQKLERGMVPRVLQIASSHRDFPLMKTVLEFILENVPQILNTDNWIRLERTDPVLASLVKNYIDIVHRPSRLTTAS